MDEVIVWIALVLVIIAAMVGQATKKEQKKNVSSEVWSRSNSGNRCPYCGKRLKDQSMTSFKKFTTCRKCGRTMPWAKEGSG